MASVCDCGPPPIFDLPPPPDPSELFTLLVGENEHSSGDSDVQKILDELRSVCPAPDTFLSHGCSSQFLTLSSANSNWSSEHGQLTPVDILPDSPLESQLQFYGSIGIAIFAAFLFALLVSLCVISAWRRLQSICCNTPLVPASNVHHTPLNGHTRSSGKVPIMSTGGAKQHKSGINNNNNNSGSGSHQQLSPWLFEPSPNSESSVKYFGGEKIGQKIGAGTPEMWRAGDNAGAHYYAPNECSVPQAHSYAGLAGVCGPPRHTPLRAINSQSAGRFRDAATNTIDTRPQPKSNFPNTDQSAMGQYSPNDTYCDPPNPYYEQIPLEECQQRSKWHPLENASHGSLVHIYNPLGGPGGISEATQYDDTSHSGGSQSHFLPTQSSSKHAGGANVRLPAPQIAPPPPPTSERENLASGAKYWHQNGADASASEASGLGSSSMADSLEEAISMSPSPKRQLGQMDVKSGQNVHANFLGHQNPAAAPLTDCNGRNGRESGYGTDSRKNGHKAQNRNRGPATLHHPVNDNRNNVWLRANKPAPTLEQVTSSSANQITVVTPENTTSNMTYV